MPDLPVDPDDEPDAPPSPTEGVRLIKPDEAAEAVERGEAVKRRGTDRPKYGDRPEAPDGPRPNLRFPLADSADPTLIVRPKVAPVERPSADDAPAAADDPALDDGVDEADASTDPAAADLTADDPVEPIEPIEPVQPIEPPTAPTVVAPLIDSPVVRPAPGRKPKPAEPAAEPIPFPAADAPEAPVAGRAAADEPGDPTSGDGPPDLRAGGGVRLPDEPPPIVTADDLHPPASPPEEPVLSLPISESTELPHWTEPATGEVPRVLIGELDDEDEDARWSSFADQGPRWRDQASGEWDPDDTGVAHLIADPEEPEVALGALDTSDRLSDEEFLNFDDLDVPQQDLPTARPRGSYDDPISIQSEPARPARPTAPGAPRPAPTDSSRTAPAPRRAPRRPTPGVPVGGAHDGPPVGPTGSSGGSGRDVPTAALVGVAIATFALILFHLGPEVRPRPGVRRASSWPAPSSSPRSAGAGSARPRCSAWRPSVRCPWPATGGASRPSRWCCSCSRRSPRCGSSSGSGPTPPPTSASPCWARSTSACSVRSPRSC